MLRGLMVGTGVYLVTLAFAPPQFAALVILEREDTKTVGGFRG